MFEQAFKNIDDILHKDAGASSELLGMSMTKSTKSIKTKYKLWKLKCQSIAKQIMTTKLLLLQ